MYELHIKGFKTKQQVECFIDWYEGQGEQDAIPWFECRMDDENLDVSFMPVDCTKPYKWVDDCLIAYLDL